MQLPAPGLDFLGQNHLEIRVAPFKMAIVTLISLENTFFCFSGTADLITGDWSKLNVWKFGSTWWDWVGEGIFSGVATFFHVHKTFFPADKAFFPAVPTFSPVLKTFFPADKTFFPVD